jgi:hypothetical protein
MFKHCKPLFDKDKQLGVVLCECYLVLLVVSEDHPQLLLVFHVVSQPLGLFLSVLLVVRDPGIFHVDFLLVQFFHPTGRKPIGL